MASFSQFAEQKMKDLYSHHSHEVGSELKKSDPSFYSSFTSTDCITYVLNVLSYAYEKKGDTTFAKEIWTYGKDPSDPGKRFKGSIMGRKLVTEKKLGGYLCESGCDSSPGRIRRTHIYILYGQQALSLS